jgi:hypothetical protein
MVTAGVLYGNVNDPGEDDWIDRVLRELHITLPPVEIGISKREPVAILEVDDETIETDVTRPAGEQAD